MVIKHYKCLQIKHQVCTALYVEQAKLDLLLVTIATEPTDGYVRFVRTAERYGYNVKVSFVVTLLTVKYSIFFQRLLVWV